MCRWVPLGHHFGVVENIPNVQLIESHDLRANIKYVVVVHGTEANMLVYLPEIYNWQCACFHFHDTALLWPNKKCLPISST